VSKDDALTKDQIQARNTLWEMGILDWKLSEQQRQIKKGILEDDNKISVVLCSRRLGKTFLMCTMAIESCLKKEYAVVKYAFPKQNMAKKMLMPVMRKILEDCPAHLKPQYISSEKCFRFPHNGSEIQFSGTDNGGFENLRGGDSDLNVVDEAGFCSDLTYGVRSVLGPTVKLTKGRTIMVSTPSRTETHEFIADWVMPYMAEDRVKIFTIYDNPQFNEEAIREAESEYPDGVNDPMFRREYLCEIQRSTDNAILPSFTNEREAAMIVDELEMPPHYSAYVSMDIGGSDLTVILFGYYDFTEATLVIQDEIVTDGSTNTEILAEKIREKEKTYWTNPIDRSVTPPYKRVSDNNNPILLKDLNSLHGISFVPTKKDNREAAINALDVSIAQGKIKIHRRCRTLVYHLKAAEWNKNRTDFKKLKDINIKNVGTVRGGHADALAAMIYMHRNVSRSYNPYPGDWNALKGSNVFKSLGNMAESTSDAQNFFEKLFSKNK